MASKHLSNSPHYYSHQLSPSLNLQFPEVVEIQILQVSKPFHRKIKKTQLKTKQVRIQEQRTAPYSNEVLWNSTYLQMKHLISVL